MDQEQKGDVHMPNEKTLILAPPEQLEAELHTLEVDTFEIEDIFDLDQNASTVSIPTSSCSSCCSSNCCCLY